MSFDLQAISDQLTRIEATQARILCEHEDSLVSLDWIRTHVTGWDKLNERAIYMRLYRAGIFPVTGTAYRRGDLKQFGI